jgi:hypothetical protein
MENNKISPDDVNFLDQFDMPFEDWTTETLENIKYISSVRLQGLLINNFNAWLTQRNNEKQVASNTPSNATQRLKK